MDILDNTFIQWTKTENRETSFSFRRDKSLKELKMNRLWCSGRFFTCSALETRLITFAIWMMAGSSWTLCLPDSNPAATTPPDVICLFLSIFNFLQFSTISFCSSTWFSFNRIKFWPSFLERASSWIKRYSLNSKKGLQRAYNER